MKNLISNISLISLLTLICISVFMTSCQKNNVILDDQLEEVNEITQEVEFEGILLPEAMAAQSDEAIADYLQGLSVAQVEKHINDYTTMKFLQEQGMEEEAIAQFNENNSFNVSLLLSAELQNELETNLWAPDQINERCCYTISQWLCMIVGTKLTCKKFIITYCS